MKQPATKHTRRWRSRAGSAMLEFAVGWFVMTTGFTAAFQYGYEFYQYNSLFKSVNNAARYAALYPYDATCTTPSTTYSTNVKNMVVYGNSTGTGSPVLTGLATTNVNLKVAGIGDCAAGTWAPTSVTVTIGGKDASNTQVPTYTVNAVFGSFVIDGKPIVQYPYQGVYQPY